MGSSQCTNELAPRTIVMNEKSLKAYQDFSDHIEKELAPSKSLEPIKGFANKLPEHAYRLAAQFASFDDINVENIEYDYIQMGIKIATYYVEEALRLFNNGLINPDILLAEKLLDWLNTKWDGDYISLPDVYQRGLNLISTKAVASEIVEILIDHGWLKMLDTPMVIKGKMRKEVYKIIRS